MKNTLQKAPIQFKNTFCVFQEVPLETILNEPHQYQSKSGSKYFFTKEGMYRLSNHWGRFANSKWRLVSDLEQTQKIKLGFAKWDQFYLDNPTDELYYIEVDFEKKSANYQHKNNPTFDQKAILRNAAETKKRLKQVRSILELTSWAKYFEYEDLDALRKTIITELVFTNTSLENIKKNLL